MLALGAGLAVYVVLHSGSTSPCLIFCSESPLPVVPPSSNQAISAGSKPAGGRGVGCRNDLS
jgi:hypothetical protein